MMPGMDGMELCARLKDDERTSHIPIILLTARTSESSKIEGLELGADDYLTKPFSTNELNIRIKNLIHQRSLLREKFSRKVTAVPSDVSVVSADEKFLSRAIRVIEDNIADAGFDVAEFTDQMALSRVQLHRKLKALTDLSTTEFIRNIRLKRAAQLLQENHGSIAEVTYAVGFSDPSYFSKRFKELFGMSPTEFQESHKTSV